MGFSLAVAGSTPFAAAYVGRRFFPCRIHNPLRGGYSRGLFRLAPFRECRIQSLQVFPA